jgi:hypothetical protein
MQTAAPVRALHWITERIRRSFRVDASRSGAEPAAVNELRLVQRASPMRRQWLVF